MRGVPIIVAKSYVGFCLYKRNCNFHGNMCTRLVQENKRVINSIIKIVHKVNY